MVNVNNPLPRSVQPVVEGWSPEAMCTPCASSRLQHAVPYVQGCTLVSVPVVGEGHQCREPREPADLLKAAQHGPRVQSREQRCAIKHIAVRVHQIRPQRHIACAIHSSLRKYRR